MDHHNLKYTLSWRRLKYCIYIFFPEVNKTIIVIKRYPFLVSVLLLPPEKGKNEQKPCWHPVLFCENSRIFQKLYLNLPNYILSTFKRARHHRETAK